MKQKLLLLILFMWNTAALNAQAPAWIWAQNTGGSSDDWGTGMATDLNGSIYITGYFNDTSIAFGTTVLPNSGSSDIFITKYDTAGNVIWARGIGGTLAEIANGISTDVNGNVFITGQFKSPVLNFGGILLTNSDPTGSTPDIFVVKYDAAGNVDWAHSAGSGHYASFGTAVCADGSGNVYITGTYRDPILRFGSDSLINTGDNDFFLVKFNNAGDEQWIRSFAGSLYERGKGLCADNQGNIFVSGLFADATVTIGSSVLTLAGGYDMFIAKYDSSGNALWAQSIGGSQYDFDYGVAADANGSVVLTGDFYSTSLTIGSTTLWNHDASGATRDFLLVKLDASGSIQWARNAGGNFSDGGAGICADPNGNYYVSGYFQDSTIVFGSTTLVNSGPPGTNEIFVVKYDSSGQVRWAQSAGGDGDDWAISLARGAGGNIFVTGIVDEPSCNFGGTTLTSHGGIDVCIAKLDLLTGLMEFRAEELHDIFPNPTRGRLTIRMQHAGKNPEVQISDLMGRVVYKKTFSETGPFDIDLDAAPGVYFVTILNEHGKRFAGKIVKQ